MMRLCHTSLGRTASQLRVAPYYFSQTRPLATGQQSAHDLILRQDDSSVLISGSPLNKSLSLPYPWLRDNCQCSRCIYPSNGHRRTQNRSLFKSTPTSVSLRPDGLSVSWSGVHEENGHHDSLYPISFLQRYAKPTGQMRLVSYFDDILAHKPWDATSLPKPWIINYEDFVQNPLPGFVRVLRDGLLLLRGVPTEGTQLGKQAPSRLEELAKKFGIMRETIYGRVWDVVNKKESTRIEFTNSPMDSHMDLMYTPNPPHIEFLHCIKNRVEGGGSVFTDALKAAHDLWYQDRDAFNLLTEMPIPFQYDNDGQYLRSLHITIQLVPKHLQTRDQPPDAPPEISSINYCQPLRAPLPIDAPVKVYSALAKFEELLSRPEARFEHILAEGDCAVFDNRRVLHARAAFWDRNALEGDADEINRWLKGCYVEKDDLLNRTRGLLAKRDSNSCDY